MIRVAPPRGELSHAAITLAETEGLTSDYLDVFFSPPVTPTPDTTTTTSTTLPDDTEE